MMLLLLYYCLEEIVVNAGCKIKKETLPWTPSKVYFLVGVLRVQVLEVLVIFRESSMGVMLQRFRGLTVLHV
jgi:hypothetical protein